MMSLIILSCVLVQTAIALYLFNTLELKDDFEKILNSILVILIFHLGSKFFILTVLKDGFLYNNNATGFSFSYGPLLYQATRTLTHKPVSRKMLLVHLLPFLLFTLGYIINSTGYLFHFIPRSFVILYKPVYHWLAVCSMIIYPVIALRHLGLHPGKGNMEEHQRRLIRVMAYILLSGVAVGLTWTAIAPTKFDQGDFHPRILPYIFLAVWPVFIVRYKMFTLISMRPAEPHGEIFPPNEIKQPERQYKKSALDKQKLDHYAADLEKFMDKTKIYLNTEISLEDLSDQIKIPKHHLTQLLNERFEKNFYVFVNEYRIQEAIRKLKDPKTDDSILSLAFDCGFNSKSSFNNYFKKITGHTPSSYRKEHLAQQESRIEMHS